MNAFCPRIICIDSDDLTTEWIRDRLNSSNIACEIASASSGREGFRCLNSQEFDLCILEYALPDMTGVQLCALMRHMGSEVPMLFFTPMNREVDRHKAEDAGASAYLSKQDDDELFVDTVSHLLKRSRRLYAMPARRNDLAKAA